jgi:hypothetical protein
MQSNVRGVAALAAAIVLAALIAAPPAGAQQQQGEDYLSSPNVTLLKRIRTAGDGVGARVVGHYLYVTSTKDLEIFDITNPEDPQQVGSLTANVEFENEEVPTNGKLLGISGQTPTVNSGGFCPSIYPATSSGCLALYDVRDKAAPKLLTNVLGAGDHTSACVLDCSYLYGSAGSVTDARGALDGKGATLIGNWQASKTIADFNGPGKSGKFVNGCHHVQQVRPGILLGACQPVLLMSVLPEDGGSILAPKVLATGSNEDGRFIHGVHWPRGGADRFLLVGGEHNFQPNCDPPPEAGIQIGAFMTWDASHALLDGKFSGPLDEWRPTNGAYLDSNPPAQILGCSVHWFEEHPTFHDGGLVALAAYENGTRFLQIGSDGKITEQGYFVPLGGSTSAPHWAPSGDVVYAVDYERGLDVLKYTGSHYVPGEPDTGTPGTGGAQPAASSGPAVCKSSAGFASASVRPVPHSHARVTALRRGARAEPRVRRLAPGGASVRGERGAAGARAAPDAQPRRPALHGPDEDVPLGRARRHRRLVRGALPDAARGRRQRRAARGAAAARRQVREPAGVVPEGSVRPAERVQAPAAGLRRQPRSRAEDLVQAAARGGQGAGRGSRARPCGEALRPVGHARRAHVPAAPARPRHRPRHRRAGAADGDSRRVAAVDGAGVAPHLSPGRGVLRGVRPRARVTSSSAAPGDGSGRRLVTP